MNPKKCEKMKWEKVKRELFELAANAEAERKAIIQSKMRGEGIPLRAEPSNSRAMDICQGLILCGNLTEEYEAWKEEQRRIYTAAINDMVGATDAE